MTTTTRKRPIQIIRRSSTIGAWGGRAALLLAAVDLAVLGWNFAIGPVSGAYMTILGWSSLVPLALLATLFTLHVRVGVESPRPIDIPKSRANDHLAVSGWISMATALFMALMLIHFGS